MELGKLDRETFMNEIKDFASGIVERCRDFTEAAKNRVFPSVDSAVNCSGNTDAHI